MARTLTLLLSLVAAWLLWSGLYKPLLLGLGAVSCLLVLYLSRRMDLTRARVFTLGLLPRILGFWGWLLKEIIKSNVEVARIVLDPNLTMQPQVVEIEADTQLETGQAILGNSITLTPGTVTLDVFDGKLKVHCLSDAGAAALKAGEMNRRVRAVMGA
jgi:multicomponent Na+:H+ antiporter subunit E